jgi:hypothetical protein
MERDESGSDVDQIYRAIGRFVVEFSHIVLMLENFAGIKLGIPPGRRRDGPDAPQRAVSRYFEMISQVPADPEERVLLRKLRSELDALIHERDRLAHDAWSINESEARRDRYRAGESLEPFESSIVSARDLQQLVEDATRLVGLVGAFWFCITTRDQPKMLLAETIGIVDNRLQFKSGAGAVTENPR